MIEEESPAGGLGSLDLCEEGLDLDGPGPGGVWTTVGA